MSLSEAQPRPTPALEAFIADVARTTTVLDLGTAAHPLADPDAVGPRETDWTDDDDARRERGGRL